MAFLTCPYFTAPMAEMKTAMANAISVIRFLMRARPPISMREYVAGGALARRFLDFDVPLFEQAAFQTSAWTCCSTAEMPIAACESSVFAISRLAQAVRLPIGNEKETATE